MWKKDDGSTVTIVGTRIEVVRKDAPKEVIPCDKMDRNRIGEFLRSRGFRKVA